MKPIKGKMRVQVRHVIHHCDDAGRSQGGPTEVTLRLQLCDPEGTPLAQFDEVTLPPGSTLDYGPVYFVLTQGADLGEMRLQVVLDPETLEKQE